SAVAQSQYSTLVALTDTYTTDIDKNIWRLKHVAEMGPKDETRVNYARLTVENIRDQLEKLNVDEKLNHALNSPDGRNDILKAASQVYGTRRFFTHESSAKINKVYEYFALYQFQLAILLTNYWNTEPQTYSPATVQELINKIHTNVKKQKTD